MGCCCKYNWDSWRYFLKTLQKRYCPKSNRPDNSRIIALGASLGELETIRGKKGLCIIRDIGIFSKRGHGTDLVHFDAELTPQIEIPDYSVGMRRYVYGKHSEGISENKRNNMTTSWNSCTI
jgi:hypothetical protein